MHESRRSRGDAFSADAARAGQAAHDGRQFRPWRVRLYAPATGTNKYQVYFRAPTGEGEPWRRVLRRASSEEEARKIFAQAEAALDTEQATPVGADVRASRTIRTLGEEDLRDSRERGKQPRTMEGRESRLNAHNLPTIGDVPVAKWRVEHSRRVMDKGSKTLFSPRGREDLRGQLAAMRKLAWRLGWFAASSTCSGPGCGPLRRVLPKPARDIPADRTLQRHYRDGESVMIEQRMIGQPGTSGAPVRNVDAIVDLVRAGALEFDAAVAYVTDSGVDALLSTIASSGVASEWAAVKKRFLVSIDWYRSDPTALERLAALPSEVRVHDGSRVVDRPGCVPFVPWHPKWFSMRGSSARGHLVGSGNLSRNGLVSGNEAGTLQIVRKPSNKTENAVDSAIRDGEAWFETAWPAATPLSGILGRYRRGFAALPKTELARNDDVADASGRVGARRGLTAEQLAALTSATNFWIEGKGGISLNRGPSRPGNQLNLSALMRVFFGGSAEHVARNSPIVTVTIEHPQDQTTSTSAPIRFSHNSMDVISLPVPASPWPTSYNDRVLLFTKAARGDALHFVLTARSDAGARAWRNASKKQGTSFSMSSGRRWGVFG